MKTGDIFELNQAPSWYIWLQHQIEWRDGSPMNLGEKCWILGLFHGENVEVAIDGKCHKILVSKLGRKCDISKVGHRDVCISDIEYPEFYMLEDQGGGRGIAGFLCKGYNRVKVVPASSVPSNSHFAFTLSVNGIARAVNRGYLERLGMRKLIHSGAQHQDAFDGSAGHRCK